MPSAKRAFGLAGWSGSGKTTLLERLIPAIAAEGFVVATLKHAHHGFDLDRPGKDSWRHRQAGASEIMVSSARRWAIVHELRGEPELDLAELIERMSPADLVLVEGFKREPIPKLEIHRPSLAKPLLAPGDPRIIAIASDASVAGIDLPQFRLDDVPGIARFILAHSGLRTA